MRSILIVASILILLMSSIGIASAGVVENLPHDTRNLPPDDSYAFFDFEDGTGHFDSIPTSQHNGTIEFVNVFADNRDQVWSYNDREHNLIHVYPQNVFFEPDRITPVNYTYLINGQYAASTVVELYIGGYYTGTYGVIEISEGANHISFLISTGNTFTMSVFDQRGNLIGVVKADRTIDRVSLPNGPSTWSLVSFDTIKSDIYSVVFTATFNDWLMDDLLIGGFTSVQPEEPTDYSWAAERLELLVGAPYNPNGFGVEFQSGEFYPAEDIVNNPLVVNWDHENKEWVTGEGINNEGAIIWALNRDANIINNLDLNDMAQKDFKVLLEYGDQKPGDVAFIEYDTDDTSEGSLGYDEIIMFVEPHIDEHNMRVDCIRVSFEDGVYYTDSEFLHNLYGITVGPEITSLFTVKSMPDSPKGNKKSPYPNIPGKFI